ncbi:hypothetical protein [Swingsia samuiensis]|uniref:HAD family hydrolase n=1 Tax=Swingsia samuiensis TaxID=1293412 RepID=A0A4Y6UGF7_9PROT|nr:hypothetical protein [Swingsia samuiensis]QDH16639.1 hypothetical protein E3D00_02915 [Swingsia samuiensis]
MSYNSSSKADSRQDIPDYFLSILKQAEVVSFDVFDTLLIRTVADPTDVFTIIERKLNILGFAEARIQAEHKARSLSWEKHETHEVNIYDIYKQFSIKGKKFTKRDIEKFVAAELEIEKSVLKASPIVKGVYEKALELGKTVIAVSDMYLSEEHVRSFLEKEGYNIKKIFVSSDYKSSKHEGGLYEDVAKKLNVSLKKIVHFGDNFHSDVSVALEKGVAGCFISSLREQLWSDCRYNQTAIHKLSSSYMERKGSERNLFSSIVAAYIAQFKAKKPTASIPEQFGAMYGGPLVVGFIIWLQLIQKLENVDCLRLATRDGYIIKKVWDLLGFDPDRAQVMQSSRRLTMLPAIYVDFEKEITSLLNTSTSSTMKECIERLSLGKETDTLLEYIKKFISIEMKIDTPVKNLAALRALRDSKNHLKKIALAEKNAYTQYMQSEGFDPKKDAFVDCGWALSSQRRTERMLGSKFRGYYIGSLEHAYMHDQIRDFLFHKGDHSGWVSIVEQGVELLELPFASNNLQVSHFEENAQEKNGVSPVYIEQARQYDIVRSAFIDRMQDQICDFAEYVKPLIDIVTVSEMREALFILFDALVNTPTPYEYNNISALPHNRELGASGFATIGTFWRTGGGHFAQMTHQPTWKDYARLGVISIKDVGVKVTWLRAKRVLRRKVSNKLKRK